MNPTIQDLASKLGLDVKPLERKFRAKHGENAESKLERHLTRLWRECRDQPHIPARQNGLVHPEQYVADPAGALPEEPESPDPDWLDNRAAEGWLNFGIVKGEEQARREARSRAERLRQAELELRQKGRSAEQHAETVEKAIAAMKREAAA